MLRLIVIAVLLLGACEQYCPEETLNQSYEKGVSDGSEAAAEESRRSRKFGYEEGYEEGYAKGNTEGYQKGFEAARPGTPSSFGVIGKIVYTAAIWGGALKLVLSLIYILWYMIFWEGSSSGHVAGKILMGVLGLFFAIIVVGRLPAAQMTESLLLSPAPESLLLQLVYILLVGAAAYWMLFVLIRYLYRMSAPLAQGALVFCLSAIITFLLPVLAAFLFRVPQIGNFVAGTIFSGLFVGTIYYFGYNLLKEKSVPLKAD